MATEADNTDPFSLEDLNILREEEACSSEEKGWKFLRKTDEGDEIWRKSNPNVSVNLVKGFLRFPGIPPKDVVELVTNLDVRRKWETKFTEIDTIEEHANYKVLYWRIAMPVGVSDRDIVQKVTKRYDESEDMTYILYKNDTHPLRPEVPGVVRAETILSGTLIRPEKDDPNSTRVTILLQNDVKGWIPAFIVNAFASKAPIEWKESLSKYYHEQYKKPQQ